MGASKPAGLSYENLEADGYFYTCRIGELALIVWKDVPTIDDARFAAHCDAFVENIRLCGQFKAAINFAREFNPSAKQRAMVKEREREIGVADVERVALVTSSPLVRGAMVALFWLIGQSDRMKPFPPTDIHNMLGWCAQLANFEVATAADAIDYGLSKVNANSAASGRRVA